MAETEKKVKAPVKSKVDLNALTIGTKDGPQTLVAKDGDRQLWKNEKGRFGVQKVVGGKYQIITRIGAFDEAASREILKTGVVPAKVAKPATPKPAAKK